ncbi:MAG: TonB-dependent receptor, partial [Deltaproteobacteria bacterium]
EPGGGRFEISGESFSLGAVQEFTLHLPQRVTWLLGGAYRGDFSTREATVVAPEPAGETGAISLTARSALFSGYLQSRVAITPKNLLTAGIRIDAPNDFAPSWNPRLAFVSEVFPGTFLKLLYGEATQTPDLFDLFNLSAGLVDGEVTGVEQNPDLEPEKLHSVEGIVQFDRWGFDLRANGYYTWIGEKIVQETGEDLVLRSYNAPETTRYAGFELEMAYRGVISPSIGYAFSRTLSDPDTADNAPAHQVYSGVEIAPTPAIHLSARLDWVGTREGRGGEDLPPYPLGRLSLFIEPAGSPLSFSMTVRNLFDTFHLSRSVTPIPAPPRSFTLTLRYRF